MPPIGRLIRFRDVVGSGGSAGIVDAVGRARDDAVAWHAWIRDARKAAMPDSRYLADWSESSMIRGGEPMTARIAGWFCLLMAATTSAGAGDFPEFRTGRYDITFEESSPEAAPAVVVERLFVDRDPPPYDIATEKFRVWVPAEYTHEREWGLLVWVDAGDAPHIPEEWEKVLAEHKLLAIAAYRSGNPRHPATRIQLAVDAAFNMRRRFHIGPRRVIVAGLSGGGRVASMIGIAYADVFAGTFAIVGANFYKPMPAPGGRQVPPMFAPIETILADARRRNRYVLLSGAKDFNRENTRDVYRRGFKAEGFRHVLYLEVPEMGHGIPPAEWFDKGLDFLDQVEVPTKGKAKARR